MKKGCLSVKNRTRSEEISEVVSNEESHHKRRSFDGKAIRQLPDQTKGTDNPNRRAAQGVKNV